MKRLLAIAVLAFVLGNVASVAAADAFLTIRSIAGVSFCTTPGIAGTNVDQTTVFLCTSNQELHVVELR